MGDNVADNKTQQALVSIPRESTSLPSNRKCPSANVHDVPLHAKFMRQLQDFNVRFTAISIPRLFQVAQKVDELSEPLHCRDLSYLSYLSRLFVCTFGSLQVLMLRERNA